MSLNAEFSRMLPSGFVLSGLQIEMGDDHKIDFILFHPADGSLSFMVDSLTAHTRLVEIQGDLEHIVETPIETVYSNTRWDAYNMEWVTTFFVRTALGEVSFIWVGEHQFDLEVRVC